MGELSYYSATDKNALPFNDLSHPPSEFYEVWGRLFLSWKQIQYSLFSSKHTLSSLHIGGVILFQVFGFHNVDLIRHVDSDQFKFSTYRSPF